jgi:hypothetical protein
MRERDSSQLHQSIQERASYLIVFEILCNALSKIGRLVCWAVDRLEKVSAVEPEDSSTHRLSNEYDFPSQARRDRFLVSMASGWSVLVVIVC